MSGEVVPSAAKDSLWRQILRFPLVRLVLALVFLGVVSKGTEGITGKLHPDRLVLSALNELLESMAALIALWGVARWIERRRLTELSGTAGDIAREAVPWFAYGAAMISAAIGVFAVCGWFQISALHPSWPVLGMAGFFLLSGVFEELVFRGIAFRDLEGLLGSYGALALTAAFFGLAHRGNPGATVASTVGIAVEAGLLLGALYMVTRRLWGVFGLHWAWNFFEGPIWGTPVSGFKFPTLMSSTTDGPALWTGGGFGPEAGLTVMILGSTTSLVLLVVAHRRGNIRAPEWWPRRKSADPEALPAPPVA